MTTWLVGDWVEQLRTLPDKSVHCCVTSPPYYGLRDYGVSGQIGSEPSIQEYASRLLEGFSEVWRVMRDDAVLWLNLGDSYSRAGKWGGRSGGKNQATGGGAVPRNKSKVGKPKNRLVIPHRIAIALQDWGWNLVDEIVWAKPNPMPSSVRDRCCASHEFVFMLTKSSRYYYDQEAIKEDCVSDHKSGNGYKRAARLSYQNADGTPRGKEQQWDDVGGKRIKRSVWRVSVHGFKGAHFATFPPKLITPMILAGTSEKGCCPKCLAPAVRVTDKTRRPTRPGEKTKVKVPSGWETGDGAHGSIHRDGRTLEPEYRDTAVVGNRDPQRHVTEVVTTGWKPSCSCGVDLGSFRPCTVLDPFGGAGTTALAAESLGRNGLMIELNADYAEMGRQRVEGGKK
jgi:DNA modification methylase